MKIQKKIKEHNEKFKVNLEKQEYFLKEHKEFTDDKGRLRFGVSKIKLDDRFKVFFKK